MRSTRFHRYHTPLVVLLFTTWPTSFVHVDRSNLCSEATAAIVSLISNSTDDVVKLCAALQSLKYLPDSNSTVPADVVVFHECLPKRYQEYLKRECIGHERKIMFPRLEYSFVDSFPRDFDYVNEQPNFFKRSKWGYQQMCRFWITFIWKHSFWTTSRYKTVMRLDADACWKPSRPPAHLPSLPPSDSSALPLVYHANYARFEKPDVALGFARFVQDYVETKNISVQNPNLYRHMVRGGDENCPMFYNNFEVSLISFMQQTDVEAFHWAITDEEPFGVFRNRWGDALVRYAVMALFAQPQQLIHKPASKPKGYSHGFPCKKNWQKAKRTLEHFEMRQN